MAIVLTFNADPDTALVVEFSWVTTTDTTPPTIRYTLATEAGSTDPELLTVATTPPARMEVRPVVTAPVPVIAVWFTASLRVPSPRALGRLPMMAISFY